MGVIRFADVVGRRGDDDVRIHLLPGHGTHAGYAVHKVDGVGLQRGDGTLNLGLALRGFLRVPRYRFGAY